MWCNSKCGFAGIHFLLLNAAIVVSANFSQPPGTSEVRLPSMKTEKRVESSWIFSKPRCGRTMAAPSSKFYLYTNASSMNEGRVIDYMDMESVEKSGYHSEGAWKVLIHGFLQHKNSFFPRVVKDAYLKRMKMYPNPKYNVLNVAWGSENCSSISARLNELLSFNTYADCTTNVALQVAYMLTFLLEKHVIRNSSDIHIVGFSLGSHIAGQAGRNLTDLTGYKLARITALDPSGPANPWWSIFPKHYVDVGQLDADFVDVLHSSSLLGTGRRTGHVDFYINGGSDQPGCMPDPADLIIKDFLQICSHNFAVDVFAKSILDNTLKGCACGPKSSWNYLKYLTGWCTCKDQAVVGEFVNPRTSGGEYYVTTPYEEINWRKYMKSLNSSELTRTNSRILSVLEVLCIV